MATAKKANSAFMKALQPSEELSEIVGSKPLPRTEVVKKLWVYIKKHGLQDKKNKRMINADDNLKAVFAGKKQVSMFDMTKLVSKHLK
jgi:chromatin remodeling complex protein RSC6